MWVWIWVSQFVRNSQLCHLVTKSLNRSPCLCLCQKGHMGLKQLCSALRTMKSKSESLTYWVIRSPFELWWALDRSRNRSHITPKKDIKKTFQQNIPPREMGWQKITLDDKGKIVRGQMFTLTCRCRASWLNFLPQESHGWSCIGAIAWNAFVLSPHLSRCSKKWNHPCLI